MRAAAAGVIGIAVAAGVLLGLSVTSISARPSGPPLSARPAAAAPATTAPTTAAATPPERPRSCVDLAALIPAYAAGQGGDARSVVVRGSLRCAGEYATAKISDPSLPDTLTVLFSVSPVRRLRSGTGPVCEVGAGEGGLPAITTAQGGVLGCA